MSARDPFEVRYAWLDDLPARLVQPVVTHVHGHLAPRGAAMAVLREALLDGRIPDAKDLAWPDEPLRSSLLDALAGANVASYCSGDPAVTDDILAFALEIVRDAHEVHDRALVAFHVLARKDEKDALRRAVSACGACDAPGDGGGDGGGAPVLIDEAGMEEVRRDADRLICELIQARTQIRWGELAKICEELGSTFEALATAVGCPPGSGRGMLRALPRTDLLEMRRLLHYLPPLQELIRALGRMREAEKPNGDTVLERIGRAVTRPREREREVAGDRGAEMRGIERSGEVARMLPSEAALLTHPVLRLYWRARWAERALLTYRARGVFTTRIQEQQTFEDGEDHRALRAERGPVLIVLDTSGSMLGFAETVAKAIIVQLVGVAFIERRRCHLYNFSGPGDLAELELSLDGDGLPRMLAFISASFHGGTEIDEALRRACDRLDHDAYRQADIAVISDGGFLPGPHTVLRLHRLKAETAARLHGVSVGEGPGFDLLECDSYHLVSGWGVHTSWS